MANVQAVTTVWNSPQYTGELYLIGANQTPFLNMIGGLTGPRTYITTDSIFSLAQPWALEAASQPSISETASMTAPTAWTYVRGQDTNTVQIVQKAVKVSYLKQSVTGQLYSSGTSHINAGQSNPVASELQFQINGALRQAAVDLEYTFLNGTFRQATSAATAAGSRGIITAVSTNSIAAGTVPLSKKLIDQLLRTAVGNGAVFQNPVIFCNAFQKQQFTSIYSFAPMDRNVGGTDIKQIETDFAMLGIVYAPKVPTDTVLLADLSVCRPVYMPVPGKGVMFYEELAKTGAGTSGQIYGQVGLDYGPEEFHGKITGLTTS